MTVTGEGERAEEKVNYKNTRFLLSHGIEEEISRCRRCIFTESSPIFSPAILYELWRDCFSYHHSVDVTQSILLSQHTPTACSFLIPWAFRRQTNSTWIYAREKCCSRSTLHFAIAGTSPQRAWHKNILYCKQSVHLNGEVFLSTISRKKKINGRRKNKRLRRRKTVNFQSSSRSAAPNVDKIREFVEIIYRRLPRSSEMPEAAEYDFYHVLMYWWYFNFGITYS